MELLKRWVPKSLETQALWPRTVYGMQFFLLFGFYLFTTYFAWLFSLSFLDFPEVGSLHWEPCSQWASDQGLDQFWDFHPLSLLLKYLTISKSLFSIEAQWEPLSLCSVGPKWWSCHQNLFYFSLHLGISPSTEHFTIVWAQTDRAQRRDGVPTLPSTMEGLELARTCVRNSYKSFFGHPEVDQMPLIVPAFPLKVSILIALNKQYFADQGI